MFIYKIYMLLFALKTVTCNCHFESKSIGLMALKTHKAKEGILPVCLNENSGLVKAWQDGFYWTHNDSGGSPELYMINAQGQLFDTLKVEGATNIDWEDLAKDTKGNIYIGDFGNNANIRTDLCIYKKNYQGTSKITFAYADQNLSDTTNRIFDCEAFFWHNDSLHLFTKSWNRGKKITKLYSIPDHEGHHIAQSKDQAIFKVPVTGADISPDGSRFALITYGKIFIFSIKDKQINFKNPVKCIKIGKNQTEAVVFENNKKIIFSNEQRKIFSVEI